MLNTVNMAKLFQKANAYKVDSTEDVQLVGGERRLVPCLPQGEMIGVITGVENVSTDTTKYIQLLIEFEYNHKLYTLNKNLFCSSFCKSPYVLTFTMLLETDDYSFDPRKPFNKNLLIGKIVRVEIGHKQFGNSEIAESTKVIAEKKTTIEHTAI